MDTSRDGYRALDKIVLVTGGCDGIGRGCVDTFVAQGAKVVVLDIQDDIWNTLGTMKQGNGGTGEMFYIHCDMRKEADVKKAADESIAKYGRFDVLINNVGKFMGPVTFMDSSIQEFRELLNLNIVSYMATAKLRKTKGCIVNIASIAGEQGQRSCVCYSAAKGAAVSFTKGLALDEGQYGVRVNSVSPGAINTPLLRKIMPPETQTRFANISPLGRLGTPEEMGKACLFLVTDATFCTGADFQCTGGSSIGYGLKNYEDDEFI